MSASSITIPNTPRTLTSAGLVSSGNITSRGLGADNTQYFVYSATTASQGNAQETLGGGGGGLVQNRRYTTINTWTAGRTYAQYGVVQSSVSPFAPYVKTTAGSITSNVDPSADAVNWALLSTQPGPSLFNNFELVAETIQLQGNFPAKISWLGEGFGTAMTLTGRPANGGATSDAELRVDGLLNVEGIKIVNTNHVADPSIGTGTLVAGVATITTGASDAGSRIFLTRTGALGSPAAGVLQIVSKTATQFVVNSVDAAGAIAATDVGTFDWVILNPNWS
jgi:hypothetical protein